MLPRKLPRKRSALVFAAASCAICTSVLAQQPVVAASSAAPSASHSAAPAMPMPTGTPMPPTAPGGTLQSQAVSPSAATPALRPTGSTAQPAARHEPAPREVKPAKAKAATAATSGCSSSMEPAEQIACLQALNAALKARFEHKELTDKLAAKTDTRALGLPSVLATYGVGAARKATLAWPGSSGGALVASVGDVIPGGYTVAEIGSGRVVLQSGSARSTLLLSGGLSSDAQGQGGTTPPAPVLTQPSSANPYSAPPMPGFGPARPAPGAGG